MFKYAKTHIPENNMDKFTEKIPSPSEANYRGKYRGGQDHFSEFQKGDLNKSIEGGDKKNDPYFNIQNLNND